jgi:serine/threonine-protein kinase Stk1
MEETPVAADDSALTYFAFAAAAPDAATVRRDSLPVAALPDTLSGRYRLERLLGVGGMGAVYRARDLLREQFGDPHPYVALKTLNEDFAEYPDANVLLYSEFALTTRLRHPNLIQLHSFEIDPGSQRAYITLEALKGCTLDQFIGEHPEGLTWAAFRDIALPLLDAVGHAHAMGVVHGDIKPSNIMLGDFGLRLFDFGLGQADEARLPGLPRLCRSRFAAWTTRYAAPELLEGEPLGEAADVYALACVLHELACGSHPYRRLSAKQAKAMSLLPALPANLPPAVSRALQGALCFDPRQRTGVRELLAAMCETAPASRFERWFSRRRS